MAHSAPEPHRTRVCPWWLMYFANHRLRGLFQPTGPVLGSLVRPGDSCLDVGCGMGYFTIPLARLVGPAGHVTAVDLQPRMLDGAARRARRDGLADRISLRLVTDTDWAARDRYDFILAMWVLHEVPDQKDVLATLRRTLKAGGRVLLVEPRLHVREPEWQASLALAGSAGFRACTPQYARYSRAAILG